MTTTNFNKNPRPPCQLTIRPTPSLSSRRTFLLTSPPPTAPRCPYLYLRVTDTPPDKVTDSASVTTGLLAQPGLVTGARQRLTSASTCRTSCRPLRRRAAASACRTSCRPPRRRAAGHLVLRCRRLT